MFHIHDFGLFPYAPSQNSEERNQHLQRHKNSTLKQLKKERETFFFPLVLFNDNTVKISNYITFFGFFFGKQHKKNDDFLSSISRFFLESYLLFWDRFKKVWFGKKFNGKRVF